MILQYRIVVNESGWRFLLFNDMSLSIDINGPKLTAQGQEGI